MLCYFGSLAEDISQIVGGQAHPHGPVTYVMIGLSLTFCVTAAIGASYLVRWVLNLACVRVGRHHSCAAHGSCLVWCVCSVDVK